MLLPKLPSFKVDGRRALVTGGSRGLGLAAAAALAQSGASVTLVARSEPDLIEAAAAIRQAGGDCDYLALDITDSKAVAAAIAAREPFQILVNSAGMNRPKLLVDMPDDDLDTVLALNVKATFYVTREVARGLMAAKTGGSIINVSSQMGHVGSPRRALYCATKHAIEGMTKSLAWELGPSNIRVNTICPTFIETAMTASMLAEPEFRNWVESKNALGRVGTADEIMGAILFLASDASSLVTGSALMIDGGWTAA
jgi:NAD(P)-dependent dehydrogenase (short-subunit alcohol dehydrogenase family)